MLYVSTRDPLTTYTAQYTMSHLTPDCGGLFVPMRLPEYDKETLRQLVGLPFWDCVCKIINQFLPVRLCSEDFRGAAFPIPGLHAIRHKVAVVELWDKQSGCFSGLRNRILSAINCVSNGAEFWPELAIDVALIFGIYGLLCRDEQYAVDESMNLAVSAREFLLPVAAVYARRMGLPVGVCVCVCNENSIPWDLLHRGEVKLDDTTTTLSNRVVSAPVNMERLIYERLGAQATKEYVSKLARRAVFTLEPEDHLRLRQGLSVSVVGAHRAMAMIPRIYHNSAYLLSPHSAMIYSGLMDHRAAGGEGTATVLLAEESPLRWGEYVLKAMKIPVESVTGQISALESKAAEIRKGS